MKKPLFNTKSNLLLLGIILAFLTLHPSNAQEKRRGENKNEAVRNYLKTTVFPTLKAQRAKLDQFLSPEEQTRIDELRQRMASLRKQQKLEKSNRKEGNSKPINLSEEERTQRKALRKEKMRERRKIQMAAFEIADRHEQEIENLLSEIKPQAEAWRKEMKALRGENHDKTEKGDFQAGKSKALRKGKPHSVKGLRTFLKPTRFLLLDPQQDNDETRGERFHQESKAFPNPMNDQISLKYTLQKKGIVSVNLYDDQGKKIRIVKNQLEEAGKHEFSMNMEELQPGTYYVEIITPSNKFKHRIIRQ
ncbi:T9SS type A sorting domain-containing protein [Xanthovirga aplysinae]|uniref:T9SS type A sorting domain-containing protein n=1 Tax=Xanthovirga aplysinae TaxID=2529853 RepID=UPI0012BBD473|nr:T9SS type A sorting domain-containing protein [Xanthovirga aplysinae]MTI32840.1 T9SS type A sorting domain-containing protein [Xanthovirga aplysinae]